MCFILSWLSPCTLTLDSWQRWHVVLFKDGAVTGSMGSGLICCFGVESSVFHEAKIYIQGGGFKTLTCFWSHKCWHRVLTTSVQNVWNMDCFTLYLIKVDVKYYGTLCNFPKGILVHNGFKTFWFNHHNSESKFNVLNWIRWQITC